MTTLQPYPDCRAIFSGNFYRMSSPEQTDYLMSPAAVLNLLIAASLAVDGFMADRLYWDLHIKQIDEQRVLEEAKRANILGLGFFYNAREKVEAELSAWFETEKLLRFFEYDFNEIANRIIVKNFLATDGKFQFQPSYAEMVEEFFSIKLLNKSLAVDKALISAAFPIEPTEAGLDLYGSVEYQLRFQAPIRMLDDGSFEAVGEFKHNIIENWSSLDFRADVLELPLGEPLSMLIFIPNDFYTLLKQSVGRDYTDFDKISAKLEKKIVHVKLPKFTFETKINLRDFFNEHFHSGFFNEAVSLDRMLKEALNVNFKIGNFWQHTSLEINALKVQAASKVKPPAKPAAVFDATEKSIFFVIKSDEVLYVMGQFFKTDEN